MQANIAANVAANIAANVVAANANFGKSPAEVSIGRDLDMTNEEDKKLYY
jgi:hypothetical protein